MFFTFSEAQSPRSSPITRQKKMIYLSIYRSIYTYLSIYMHIYIYIHRFLTFREAQSPLSSPITRQKKMRSGGMSTTCLSPRPCSLSAVRSSPFFLKKEAASARA